MKKLLLIVSILPLGLTKAQVKFGVNAGLATNFTDVKTSSFSGSDSQSGFYAGVFTEFGLPLAPLKIQPAVNYVNVDDSSYIQIPVMFKYYFIPKINLQAGPQIAFTMDNVPTGYSGTNIGLGIGLGADIIAGLLVEARYAFQLNNMLDNPPSGDHIKFNVMNIGVGYRF